jgi:hypothetical protein
MMVNCAHFRIGLWISADIVGAVAAFLPRLGGFGGFSLSGGGSGAAVIGR